MCHTLIMTTTRIASLLSIILFILFIPNHHAHAEHGYHETRRAERVASAFAGRDRVESEVS